jgi:plasmid stability protein
VTHLTSRRLIPTARQPMRALALLALLALLCEHEFMATIVIRNLDEKVKRRLQVRAALNGRSMEAEARELLSRGAEKTPEASTLHRGLGTAIHDLFAPLGGVELQIPSRRKSHRPIPTFDE